MALIIYASLIRPEYETVLRLRGILESKFNLQKEEREAIIQVENLIAQQQGAVKLEDQLLLALPEEESVSSVMAQINAIAQINGILTQSVGIEYLPIRPAVARLVSGRNVGVLRLDLKLAGSYAALKGFLQHLEKNIRLMDVKTLRIEPGGKSDQDFLTYNLSVDTYYQAK